MRKTLIEKRKAEDYTQAEIAKKIGISVRQYKYLEAGTSDGSMKVWQELKRLLKTPIDSLIEQS